MHICTSRCACNFKSLLYIHACTYFNTFSPLEYRRKEVTIDNKAVHVITKKHESSPLRMLAISFYLFMISQLRYWSRRRLSSVVSTKIARSGDLGIWATHKCNVSVNTAEKLASVYFELFGKANEHCKYCVLLGHAYGHCPPCALCSCAQPGTICR